MTKSDIKDYMIVETGYDDSKYLVMKGCIVRLDDNDELEGFLLEDFDGNLIHTECKPFSIHKVYESVYQTLESEFKLDVEGIFSKHRPKLIWKREPTPVSQKYLESLPESEVEEYIMNLVYPCIKVG